MSNSRLLIILLLGTLKCAAQRQFETSTRLAISAEARGYYDSAQYELLNLGSGRSKGINVEMQWNLTPKLSWNNELQLLKYYPDGKSTSISDVYGVATRIKGYWFVNDENYDGISRLINPYAQYGFLMTNVVTDPGFHFISMLASIGTEFNVYRLKRGFVQMNYSLGYGSKARNYVGFQCGYSYNFDERKREEQYIKSIQNEKKLEQLNNELTHYKSQMLQDSIEKISSYNRLNMSLQQSNAFTDSLMHKTKELTYQLRNCQDRYQWALDSLDIATKLLQGIYINQWQNFEWVAEDGNLKSKNGYFAMVLQTYDLDEIMANKTASSLPLPYAIIKNKFNAYRLLYFVGIQLNSKFDKTFEKVLEVYPAAEILKLEDF